MSKNWGFGGFWLSRCGLCHCSPPYDTFLESLGLGEYSEMVSKTYEHHQDDQEGKKCPKTGVLEDFGCLDVDFVIVPQNMIPFWNRSDQGSTQKWFPELINVKYIEIKQKISK